MGETTRKQFFEDDQNYERFVDSKRSHLSTWMNTMNGGDGDGDAVCDFESIESSCDDTMNSDISESESELKENSSTSSSSTSISSSLSHSNSNGPLYELSELMIHLPIKRGLSKYYEGKSQSYISLARVESVEDLAKTDMNSSYSKRFKYSSSCKSNKSKSFANGLEGNNKFYKTPKPTISKKTLRVSFLSLGNRSNLMSNCKSPISSFEHKL